MENVNSINILNSSNKHQNNKITVMQFNIAGLASKCDNLSILLSTYQVNILCLSEHWLKQEEIKNTVIENFKLVTSFSRTNYGRGGVCIFAKNNMDINEIPCNDSIERNLEICMAEIRNSNIKNKICIISLYRTPDSDVKEFVHRLALLLHKIYNKNDYYIICGDININFLDDNKHKNSLINLLLEYNIKHHIKEATRTTSNSATCIDNIFSNLTECNTTICTTFYSDHTSQICSFEIPFKTQNNIEYTYRRNLNKNNIEAFQNIISREDWSEMYNADTFDNKFYAFYNTFMHHYNCVFPITKSKSINTNKPWYNPQIKLMHDQLCEMEKIQKELNNPQYTTRYKEFKKMYKNSVKNLKKQKNDHRLRNAQNVSRESWKIINELKNNTENPSIDVLDDDGNLINNTLEKCNRFNNYFISLSQNCPKPDSKDTNKHISPVSLYLNPTTDLEIENILNKTTRKTAAGIDEIHGKVLKSVSNQISQPLSYLINESFISGKFPEALKESKCIPVYKNKGSKMNIINYRSICVQSQLAKLFEASYSVRLVNFLETFNLLTNNQNGFRGKKSTNTAILQCLEFVYEALNNRENVLGLFYDLSRAFDTINHNLLAQKLFNIGVRGVAHEWAVSYLRDRTQTVVLDGNKSDTLKNGLGVPQGSILGPIFFIIFVNDITEKCSPSNHIILYADDTNILIKNKNTDELVHGSNDASDEVLNYFTNNGLILNAGKTFYMQFLPKNVSLNYDLLLKVQNKSIQSKNTIKFLGLNIDQKLTWEPHIIEICSKLSTTCYIIIQLRDTVTYNILKLLYFGLVQSVLQYGIIFWGSSSHMNKAFAVQKKILRCMNKSHPLSSCKQLFRKYGILTLPSLYIYELLLYIIENSNQLIKNKEVHSYNTRKGEDIYQPYSRLSVGQHSPVFMGTKCLNKINSMIQINNTRDIKTKVYKILLNNAFYSVNEFFQYCDNNVKKKKKNFLIIKL